MRKQDPYCYPETSVLKNKFNIREVSLLEKAEADLSRAKMSILYESPVDKFDAQSFLRVHEFLFEEVYDWAGQLRTINISKPEEVLGGKSIWYEDALDLPESLDRACTAMVQGLFKEIGVSDAKERCISDKWFHMENNSIDNAERTGKGVKFERLRRIKVYLVGKVDRWNDTKKSELNDCAKQV